MKEPPQAISQKSINDPYFPPGKPKFKPAKKPKKTLGPLSGGPGPFTLPRGKTKK